MTATIYFTSIKILSRKQFSSATLNTDYFSMFRKNIFFNEETLTFMPPIFLFFLQVAHTVWCFLTNFKCLVHGAMFWSVMDLLWCNINRILLWTNYVFLVARLFLFRWWQIEVVNPDESPAQGVTVVVNPGAVQGLTAANGIAKLTINTVARDPRLTITVSPEIPWFCLFPFYISVQLQMEAQTCIKPHFQIFAIHLQ